MTSTEAWGPFMDEALGLAPGGRFRVEPNPLVGAVVVSPDGEVVGRGFHALYGEPHAEILALVEAGESAQGATMLTTLEPCAHKDKKTPPCVAALVDAGVARVVFGASDPNPATTGRAIRELAEAGIEVVEGVRQAECRALIERYAAHLGRGVPWVISKWAMSADGRIADDRGLARWISCPESRAFGHQIRGRVEAIAVGVGTVLLDDPSLDCRADGLPTPLRVVFDSRLRTPTDRRVVTLADRFPTVIVHVEGASDTGGLKDAPGVELLPTPPDADGRVDVEFAVRALHDRGVRRLLLEGGGTVAASAMRAGVVSQVMAFTAPLVIGGDAAPTPFSGVGFEMPGAPRLEHPRVLSVGVDSLLEGYWPSRKSAGQLD